MAAIKSRFPLFFFLSSLLLAFVSVSVGIAYSENENPNHHVCLRSCASEHDVQRYLACHAACKLTKKNPERPREREEEEEPQRREEQEGERRRHREERESQEEEEEKEQRPRRQEREGEQERRHQEQEQTRRREKQRSEQEERRGRREDEERRREKEREGEGSRRQKHHNPFHFSSERFQTRFKNEHGRIRVLQRFDQRSKHLRGLQNYRLVEFESKHETLILPHHSDAEYLFIVLRGRAIVTLVNPNNRESYNVEHGDVLRIPAGATTYVANRDDNQNLRAVKLVIPINIPGEFEDFYPSGNQNPQSYYSAFSRNTLEATFNTQYEEVQRILFGEQQRGREQEQEQEQSEREGVIVKVSKEQIRELSRHAKSSPSGGKSSKSGPLFNLRNLQPRYSNNFGKFFEARPEETQLLQDLGISVTSAELNEGALLLPHFNSRAIVVAVVAQGKGQLEIGSPHLGSQRSREEQSEERGREQQQEEEEEEEEGQIQRLTSKLSQGDVFVIPAGYPFALKSSQNLQVVGFGLNAENNQRNFLAGERDNVINQIERQVKEVAFGGSGEEVERLYENQKESYFVNAQAQQREGREGRKAPLSSI